MVCFLHSFLAIPYMYHFPYGHIKEVCASSISMPVSVKILLPNTLFIEMDENIISCVNNGAPSTERSQLLTERKGPIFTFKDVPLKRKFL